MNWTTSVADEQPSGEPLADETQATGREEVVGRGEHCVRIVGSTGQLGEAPCTWAGFQCLCELGARESATYVSAMQARAHARQRRAERHRVWAATILTVAVGLPLVFDRQVAQLRLWALLKLQPSKVPDSTTVVRTLGTHLGWGHAVPRVWAPSVGMHIWELGRSPSW